MGRDSTRIVQTYPFSEVRTETPKTATSGTLPGARASYRVQMRSKRQHLEVDFPQFGMNELVVVYRTQGPSPRCLLNTVFGAQRCPNSMVLRASCFEDLPDHLIPCDDHPECRPSTGILNAGEMIGGDRCQF